MYMYIYIYIYIYIHMCIHVCVYIYIYIYITSEISRTLVGPTAVLQTKILLNPGQGRRGS